MSAVLDALNAVRQELPWLFYLGATLLGLAVGSFLNVVIHRLPRMMERAWRSECAALLEQPDQIPPAEEAFNLVRPRSCCPGCGRMITARDNLPLLSWLWLRGQCRHCGMRIALRYPLVELLTAIFTVLTLWHFGPSLEGLAGLVLVWSLIALSFIDLEHQLLPDQLTLPVLWLGLLLSLHPDMPLTPEQALIGAAAGYLSLWSVYHVFRLATGKEGMGYGDFKLMGLLGAWMGWTVIPLVVLLGSVLGLLAALGLALTGRRIAGVPMPFGPFLAGAGLVALFIGEPLITGYLHLSGL